METNDLCEITCVNKENISNIQKELSGENTQSVANIFKALSDETRVKIAYALTQSEFCVCDIAEIVGATTATASHHLRLLKKLGIAKHRKEGKQVYYSLDDDHVKQLIELTFTHQRRCAK